MSFQNTLKQFRRKNDIEVDCGDGFIITVRKASLHNQEFRAKVAEFTTGKSKRDTKRVSIASPGTGSLTGTNDPKKDAEFFFNVFIVKWRGLKNDKGTTVAPSASAAVELFATDEGQILMELILAETTNDSNFVIRDWEEKRIAGE